MITTIVIALILLDIVVVTYLTEAHRPGPFRSLFVIAGSIAIYYFLVKPIDFNAVLEFTRSNSANIIYSIIAWVVIGVVWSFFRWYVYLKDSKRSQDDLIAFKLQIYKREVAGREQDIADKLRNPRTEPRPVSLEYTIPQAADNKERITTWMVYWPFSVLGYLATNPIQRMYRWIYEHVSGVYDKMTLSVFK